ncbi:uncharacterized protein VNE69_12017 [Vairimorpha necatrix]|uniref:Membrane protein n=1 Tax=Vairimorpha necatrix TaxID=6039 RepID=A0AAX4JGC6_9MICR
MLITELLYDFYSTQREVMELNDNFLLSSLLVSLLVYFFSMKNIFLSIFPLVLTGLRYIGSLYLDNSIVSYIMSTWIRSIITAFILTYCILSFTKILISLCIGISLLHLTDKYTEYLNTSIYVWIILVIIGVTFYTVRILQQLINTIVAAVYSTMVLLNSVEILTNNNFGMKELELEGIFLVALLAVFSVFLQVKIHKTKY